MWLFLDFVIPELSTYTAEVLESVFFLICQTDFLLGMALT